MSTHNTQQIAADWDEAVYPYHAEAGDTHVVAWHEMSAAERESVMRFARRYASRCYRRWLGAIGVSTSDTDPEYNKQLVDGLNEMADIANKQADDVERLLTLSPNDPPELREHRAKREDAFRALAALAWNHASALERGVP